MLAQLPPSLHHAIEGTLSAAVDPVGVVDFARTIDAKANQEIVLLEKGAPVIVEKDAVGLEGVLDSLLWPAVLFDDFDGAPEEVELHQRRFAALPCNSYVRC